MTNRTILIVAILLLVPAGTALAQTNPAGPVTNGDFEQPVAPPPVVEPLEGSALDNCYGIGHQALYGSDSTQATVTGTEGYTDLVPPTSGNAEDVQAWIQERATGLEGAPGGVQDRAEDVQDDPEGEAQEEKQFQVGPDNCYFSSKNGQDLVWLTPVRRMQQPVHWSLNPNNPGVAFGYNLDEDPFDREAVFPADPSVSNFNMWQWAGSPHQAWTANADAFEFDVENDVDIHDGAHFQLILTPIPVGSQDADPSQLQDTAYNDCQLSFDGVQLEDARGADGHVEASPVNADFRSKSERCDHLEDAWANAETDEDKRDVLRQVRINQLNFRGWNLGDDPIVIDNVALTGASTAPQGAVGAAT